MSSEAIVCHWFRRDLRLEDNTALHMALQSGKRVLPVFIFDWEILNELPRLDYRVIFIHRELAKLKQQLRELGSDLYMAYGKPENVWQELFEEYKIAGIYTNRDYEPYAKQRDAAIRQLASTYGASFNHYKDHVVFDEREVLTQSEEPYKVFTPYSRAWRARLKDEPQTLADRVVKTHLDKLLPVGQELRMPSLAEMGFQDDENAKRLFPSRTVEDELLEHYQQRRDYPAQLGTSRLGMHLRFGTISIRRLARHAQGLSGTYLNELIWRDFYSMILDYFPHVVQGSFRPAYDAIPWRNNEEEFEAWKQGQTGYPIVDAGMRELNTTGYMHNRVRMIVASFLTKHLLIDWRWGEAYFAEKLLDFDLASNNGGWQWAAGSGTDAAPYFRIFNPESQTKKFDPKLAYTRRWVPELESFDYPKPIVEHKAARERCLQVYKTALEQARS